VTASRRRPAATEYLPDLLAVGLTIIAHYSNDTITISGLVENIGIADASGPFAIAISVNLYTGNELTSYNQLFEVPANVTLYGTHVLPPFPSPNIRPPLSGGGIITPQPSSYQTPDMVVPLLFNDMGGSYYTAQMLVDPYYQVNDPNRANNYYTWPGEFWFMSLSARKKKGPFIIKRTVAARP
jgi:hypothetical protein